MTTSDANRTLGHSDTHTDNLRTRIMAVLRERGWTCEYHEPVDGPDECSQCDDSHGKTADAVIRELGMHQEWLVRHESGGGGICHSREDAQHKFASFKERPPGVDDPGSGRLTGIETRHVTEWVKD